MKYLIVVAMAMSLVGCDSTEVTSKICEGNLSPVGIKGKYEINLFGQTMETEILTTSTLGRYQLTYRNDGDLDTA